MVSLGAEDGAESSRDDPEGHSPERPVWRPYWPMPVKVIPAFFLVILALAAALAFASAVPAIRDGDWIMLVDGLAPAIAMSLLCWTSLGFVGLSRSGVPRTVEPVHSEHHGAGLLFRCRSRRPFAVAILAFGIWGFVASAVQHFGTSESLLPASRDNSFAGLIVLIGSIVLVAFVAVMPLRTRTDVSVYVNGIMRRTYKRRWRKDRCTEEFVGWNDIDVLRVDTHDVHTIYLTVQNPVIRVESASFDTSRKLQRADTRNSIALRVYELGADPNAIMALVLWLERYQWARNRLQDSRALALLEAPPLRERLQLSRAAVAEKKRQVKR